MYILMIAHIGETLGHLVRGLAIADALAELGIEVGIATSMIGNELLSKWERSYKHHQISWTFSHNSINTSSAYINHVIESYVDVLNLLKKNRRPDLIVGLPGIFTAQVARHLNIPHVSVLHGPYLSPIVELPDQTALESTVINFVSKLFCDGPVDIIYSHLAHKFGLNKLTYREYLHTEPILVPQPGLPLSQYQNIRQVGFIRASFGPPLDFNGIDIERACHITFGSGNPCDISRIIQLTSMVYPLVIVATGLTPLSNVPKNVIKRPFIASSSLAGRVPTVISHGGIGTVGTFAEYGTSQLIIPTEPDQATMAIHGARLGITDHCGLESWATNPELGRHIPPFSDEEFFESLVRVNHRSRKPVSFRSSGSRDIASIISHMMREGVPTFHGHSYA